MPHASNPNSPETVNDQSALGVLSAPPDDQVPPCVPRSGIGEDSYLTLIEACGIAPGRPSVNCFWRWCRKGILARNGQRIRIRHIRSGGKVLTTRQWVNDFFKQLADRDAEYFDGKAVDSGRQPPRESRYGPPRRRQSSRPQGSGAEQEHRDDIEQELDEEGI